MELTQAEQTVLSKGESGRYHCPECAHIRKKKNPTLVVTFKPDHVLYDCHHCNFSGRINMEDPLARYREMKNRSRRNITPIPTQLNQEPELIRNFFLHRGIDIPDLSALEPLTITTAIRYFPSLRGKAMAIGFVYGDKAEPEAIKWRPADGRKSFVQDGAAASFFGIDRLGEGTKDVIIVEGEADVVALQSIGITAISVPNGAPMKVLPNKRIHPDEDRKFAYLWEARELLKQAERIILATDQDGPGEALAEEISRRVTRAKCWRVTFPEDCKDPTDVIVNHGADEMRRALENAKALPLQGVFTATDYATEVNKIYSEGMAKGESTGLDTVDNLFTLKEGMLYVVTGYPGNGKSEFCDQLMLNVALNKSWKWAVASFENPPPLHIIKMAEKVIGKPFFKGVTPRMRPDEVAEAVEFINDHFSFLENRSGLATIESIMDRTLQARMRMSIKGLIIDPYNYIDMRGENEHQNITRMLTELGVFARTNDIAVVFVAHPQKVRANQDGNMPVPTGHHISGSAAWFAKSDIGVTVHRGEVGVEIHCWKARFKWLGQTGDTVIGYDVPTGRYFEQREVTGDGMGTTGNKFTRRKTETQRGHHWMDAWEEGEDAKRAVDAW